MASTSPHRVYVLGSSISMLVRPEADADAYPRILEELLNASGRSPWFVENRSRIAGTIDDVVSLLEEILCARPDVVVIHHGFTEALLRPHSRPLWFWTYMRVPGRHPKSSAIRALGRWYSSVRRRMPLMRQWVPSARFERRLAETIAYIRSETRARVIVIEANPWNDSVERFNPGSRSHLDHYNRILQEVASREGAEFLALDALTQRDPGRRPVQDWIPDGTHFNADGHRVLAEALASVISAASRLSPPAGTRR